MAKYYHGITKQPSADNLTERMKAKDATPLPNNVTATSQEIVWKVYLKHYFMPYTDIVWAYRQVAESHVTLGCCGGVLQEFRIIMRDASGKDAMVIFDREPCAIQLLDIIHAKNPACAIGFTKENKERFGVPPANTEA